MDECRSQSILGSDGFSLAVSFPGFSNFLAANVMGLIITRVLIIIKNDAQMQFSEDSVYAEFKNLLYCCAVDSLLGEVSHDEVPLLAGNAVD